MLSDKATEKVRAAVIEKAAANASKAIRDELRTRYAGWLLKSGRLRELSELVRSGIVLAGGPERVLMGEATVLADADLAARKGEA